VLNLRINRIIAAGTVGTAGLAALAALPAAQAGASTSSVNVSAKCSGTSVANLQLQREDTGKLSIDFGVDMARHIAGVPWKVTDKDNGTLIVNTTKLTAPDGSFSVSRVINPAPGTNAVTGHAVNALTGETCAISASI
jgi:hypothetical protein